MILQDKNGKTIEIAERTIFYDSPMESVEICSLMNEIQECKENIINIYWSCEGGAIHVMAALVDFIRTQEKFFNIILSGLAMSSGLGFLIEIKDFENVCISNVLPTAIVMAHDTDIQLSKRDLSNKNSQSYHMLIEREVDMIWEKIHKGILTVEEMEDFKRGLDIFISTSRAKEYLVSKSEKDSKIEKIKRFMLSSPEAVICEDADFSGDEIEHIEDENVEEIVERLEIESENYATINTIPKIRGFEPVKDEMLKNPDVEYQKPKRGTAKSAGYDFCSTETIVLKPGQRHTIFTDVKTYMQPDEVLKLFVRSSAGIKKGLALQNGTGIIDSDYYSNISNDGNIGIPLVNTLQNDVEIKVGERIAQGVFVKYLIADDDDASGERTGGTGSTGK